MQHTSSSIHIHDKLLFSSSLLSFQFSMSFFRGKFPLPFLLALVLVSVLVLVVVCAVSISSIFGCLHCGNDECTTSLHQSQCKRVAAELTRVLQCGGGMPLCFDRLPTVQSKNVGCRRCGTHGMPSRSPKLAVHPSICLLSTISACAHHEISSTTSILVVPCASQSFRIRGGALPNGGGDANDGCWAAESIAFLCLHFSMDNIST